MRKGRFERPQVKEDEKSKGDKPENVELSGAEEDLAVIHPIVDGRLKDEGRKSAPQN